MSRGHYHQGGAGTTQNQGNQLGDRPCVRQSRLFREHDGGNTMKELMGQSQLKWDTRRTEGAYQGGRVYDHNTQEYQGKPGQRQPHPAYAEQPQQQQESAYDQQRQQQVSQAPWAMSTNQPQQPQQQQQRQQVSQAPWASDQQQQPATQSGGHRKNTDYTNQQTYNLLTNNI